MANLTAAKRRKLPKDDFEGPGRSFPVEDKKHAREAISGATRSERDGNISPATETRIKTEARRKLDSGKPGSKAKASHPSKDGLAKYARELGGRLK